VHSPGRANDSPGKAVHSTGAANAFFVWANRAPGEARGRLLGAERAAGRLACTARIGNRPSFGARLRECFLGNATREAWQRFAWANARSAPADGAVRWASGG
jgi:hypothetical protein